MSTISESDADVRFQAKQDAIAKDWYDVIMGTCFVALDPDTLCESLVHLSGRVVNALFVVPPSQNEAEAIGQVLAAIRYTSAETLGGTLAMLASQLVDGLRIEDVAALQPSVARLMGGIATGFLQEKRRDTLAEQQAMHRALLRARQQAESALLAADARYRAVITQTAEGIILVDPATARIRESNPAFQQLLGYTQEELAQLTLYDVVAHERASVDRNIRQAAKKGRYSISERRYRRKDGRVVTVEGSASTIATPGGKLLCIVVRDITQRAQAEADLAEARRGLAASREQERVRLAQELHDGAVQEMAALRYQLAAARGRIRDDVVDGVDEQIKAVEQDIAKVIGQLRGLIAELRPTGLDDKGLAVALGNYVGGLAGEAIGCRPEITLDVSPDVANLPTSIALCLFRVTQEAIRNAVHHGHRRQVIVRLRARSRDVILRVRDDGRGFAVPTYLSALTQAEHYGLVGMAERVAQVNGRLRIRSRAGEGTIVTVWLPLSFDERGQDGDDAHPLG